MEKSKVLIQFLVIFRQFGDVLFFLYARRLRGYTATKTFNCWLCTCFPWQFIFLTLIDKLLKKSLLAVTFCCNLLKKTIGSILFPARVISLPKRLVYFVVGVTVSDKC